ncbi:C40 family peptidase [Actinocorallia populi]|uniref:C40 family peptidase n=1 Tax=Actinocorallia populi TaxID=2079200 RepID=UPI000D094230|nr:bifunctional lytic transglycosylase/C40 family peptidase [Actinocorallia populi]
MLKPALGAGAALLALPVLTVVLLTAHSQADGSNSLDAAEPTDEAINDIPPAYLRLYQEAARPPGLTWNVLAAIGDIETDHGRNPPHCIPNAAGAAGPMQFLAITWSVYGIDGNRDGRTDRCDPADAIPGAANYLAANGAVKGGKHLEQALWHYNHADWYVRKVLDRAKDYAAPPATGDGAKVVKAALRWLGTPYSWGGGGPSGPTYGIQHGADIKGFDCSGLAQHAWSKAGINLHRVAADQYNDGPHIPRDKLQPGDLVFFATNPANPRTIHHVGINIGKGRMVHAPHTGDVVRIAKFADVPYREREYAGATRPVHK